FESFWSKRLHPALFDRPSVIAESINAQAEVAPLQIKLLGTILERDRSMALFSTPRSAVELRGISETVGDAAEGAEVVEISRDQVVVRHQGKLVVLKVPGPTGG